MWFTCFYLWGDDLYGRHEAVCNDGHSQEHVHERDKVDHSSGHLVTEPRLVGFPDGKQDALCAVADFSLTSVLLGRNIACIMRHGGLEGKGEHGGRDHPLVGAAARFAALRLRLTGRQWQEENEEEEEKGIWRGRERHGSVCVSHKKWEQRVSQRMTRLVWGSEVKRWDWVELRVV